jgi:hypothetical protein
MWVGLSGMDVGEGELETNMLGKIFRYKRGEVTKDWEICIVRSLPVCVLHLL